MSMPPYQIRQCERASCRFRFPVTDERVSGEICPYCDAPTTLVTLFDNYQMPASQPQSGGTAVELLLDNIRSVYNVGTMLRTADGAGVRHVHLCGVTASPHHPQMAKTSLGAELAVPWTQHKNGVDTAVSLKQQGYRLWAIEGTPQAQPLFEIAAEELPDAPIVLVVGNEISGVDPGILAQCDRILWIPMQGHKQSLNVGVAFGIAVYTLRYGTDAR